MKKLLLIFIMVLFAFTLNACGRNKKVYEAYYFVEEFTTSGSTEPQKVNSLKSYESYRIILFPNDLEFEVIEKPSDKDKDDVVYTGTYKINGDKLTFSYDDDFKKTLESVFGKEVYELKNDGEELYFYQFRDKQVGENHLGPITIKLKLK